MSEFLPIIWENLPAILKIGSDIVRTFRNDTPTLEEKSTINELLDLGVKTIQNYNPKNPPSDFEKAFCSLLKITYDSANDSLKIINANNVKIKSDKKFLFDCFENVTYDSSIGYQFQPFIIKFIKKITEQLTNSNFSEEQRSKFVIHFGVLLNSRLSESNIEFENFSKPQVIAENLENYLTKVIRYNEFKFTSESIPLKDYYVEPDIKKLPRQTWHKRSEEITEKEGSSFCWDDFLNGNPEPWYIVLGASFGMGKSALGKIIAAKLARNFKFETDNPNRYIPILVELKTELNGTVYDDQRKLDVLLETIISPYMLSKDNRIVLLLDIQTEYKDQINDLIANLDEKYRKKYRNLKVIILTRLEPEYPKLLNFNSYIRLQYFSPSKVKDFFINYGAPELDYDILKQYGLQHKDICKPLFCWIISSLNKKSTGLSKFQDSWTSKMRRTALYFEFAYNIMGGHYIENNPSKFTNMDEKRILWKIASLKQMNKTNLTQKEIKESLHIIFGVNLEDERNSEALKSIFNSHVTSLDPNYEKFNFTHNSFQEYFLAEYYLECIINKQPVRLCVGLPSSDCIEFLIGWLELISSDDDATIHYLNKHIENLKKDGSVFNYDDVNELKKDLILGADVCFKTEQLITTGDINTNLNGWSTLKINLKNFNDLWMHRWLSFLCLGIVAPNIIDKHSLSFLIKNTSSLFPFYFKQFKSIDLSHTDLSTSQLHLSHFENTNLTGTKLNQVIFSDAILIDTVFVDSELEGTDFTGTKILCCDFTGADLSRTDFCSCILSKIKFNDSILAHVNFSGSKFILEKEFDYGISNLKNKINNKADFTASFILHTNLENVMLPSVSFEGALISDSDLSQSHFCNGVFSDAALVNSDIHCTDFSKAIFIRASIENTSFEKSITDKADFEGAFISKNNNSEIDSSAKNMDTIKKLPLEIPIRLKNICDELRNDRNIRFAGIFDQGREIRYGGHTDNSSPLLTEKDKSILLHIVWISRLLRIKEQEETHNPSIYTLTHFESLTMFTIPFASHVILSTVEPNVETDTIDNQIKNILSNNPRINSTFVNVTNLLTREQMNEISTKYEFKKAVEKIKSNLLLVTIYDDEGNAEKIFDDQGMPLITDVSQNTLNHMWRRWRLRSKFERKIGKPEYNIVVYEKHTSISIPLKKNKLLRILLTNCPYVEYVLRCALAFKNNTYT